MSTPASGPAGPELAGGRARRASTARERPTAGLPAGPLGSLAERQEALVAALTAGAAVPPGFDGRLVEVARVALLRKRAGEVARQWPELALALGGRWMREWMAWAATRPTQGSLRDGWDLARWLRERGELPPAAGAELASREAALHYDGKSTPRRRRLPALRRASGAVALQTLGTVRILRRA